MSQLEAKPYWQDSSSIDDLSALVKDFRRDHAQAFVDGGGSHIFEHTESDEVVGEPLPMPWLRFKPNGDVLSGPAESPLEKV